MEQEEPFESDKKKFTILRWFHDCTQPSTLIDLSTLNMFSLLYATYVSIKPFLKYKKIIFKNT